MDITISLNEVMRTLSVEPHDTLLHVLRREGLTSARFGSDTGETGAAAVLVDDRLVNSDCLLAAQADGHEIITLEWFNQPELHPIQAAFLASLRVFTAEETHALFEHYRTPEVRSPPSARAAPPRDPRYAPRPGDLAEPRAPPETAS